MSENVVPVVAHQENDLIDSPAAPGAGFVPAPRSAPTLRSVPPPPSASVRRTDQDGTVVLHLDGEFDIASVGVLRGAVLDAVDADSNRLVLDLSGTEFVDSTTLGVVLATARRARAHGGWVRLAAPRPQIHRVLRITGLVPALALHDTVAGAVAPAES